MEIDKHFTSFQSDITGINPPKKFTYPFFYKPHPLAEIAARELQEFIQTQNWNHNFGLELYSKGLEIGKMFGVLVVRNKANELGYLASFSGKLADSNHHPGFVPPVFDMLTDGSFFLEGEEEINTLNDELEHLENDKKHLQLKDEIESVKKLLISNEESFREEMRQAKAIRKTKRKNAKKAVPPEDYQNLIKQLAKESIAYKKELAQLRLKNVRAVDNLKTKLSPYTTKIDALKKLRKAKSAQLQDKLFNSYTFLNYKKDKKGLLDIFKNTVLQKPPAGAGECAAPKLLQHAFKHNFQPVALAEFWWGAPPNTAVRKHQQFYPACQGKCKPILEHMLKGVAVDDNPLLHNPGADKVITTVYEDDSLLVINKPHDLLSVPGKEIKDSVYTRIKNRYPTASGPLLVHRLDMSTSGLLLIAKTKTIHAALQEQFVTRSVKKSYTALLDGYTKKTEGTIELPLNLDFFDRPRQKVDVEHGKSAKTRFNVVERSKGKTRIQLVPITGRTHQLRVHCAHIQGLQTPILGDDLYGKAAKRLYLHATTMEIVHPVTKETLYLEVEPNF